MSETKHTPGPWTIKPRPQDPNIAPAWQNHYNIVNKELNEQIAEVGHYLPNARLIAAAPALLAACKDLVRTADGNVDTDGAVWFRVDEVNVLKIKAAIALAEEEK